MKAANDRLDFTGTYFRDYAPPKRRRWVLGGYVRLLNVEYAVLALGIVLVVVALIGGSR